MFRFSFHFSCTSLCPMTNFQRFLFEKKKKNGWAICVVVRGDSLRLSVSVSKLALSLTARSPSPWAGGAACCVGRGYTCSELAPPPCRYTFHLRPEPSCRSANLLRDSGTAPAEQTKKICKHFEWALLSLVIWLCCVCGHVSDFMLSACINGETCTAPPIKHL